MVINNDDDEDEKEEEGGVNIVGGSQPAPAAAIVGEEEEDLEAKRVKRELESKAIKTMVSEKIDKLKRWGISLGVGVDKKQTASDGKNFFASKKDGGAFKFEHSVIWSSMNVILKPPQ